MRPHIRATQALLVEVLWSQGLSAKQIALRTGLTKNQVYGYADDHRDRCPYRQPALPHAVVARLWREGLTARDIVARLATMGVSTTEDAIYAHAMRSRADMPKRTRGGAH